jgi:hypothetical protein
VRSTLPSFIVSRIEDEADRRKRNALIADAIDYPHHNPAWARSFIESMTADTGRNAW